MAQRINERQVADARGRVRTWFRSEVESAIAPVREGAQKVPGTANKPKSLIKVTSAAMSAAINPVWVVGRKRR
jgi:hypothetical protein